MKINLTGVVENTYGVRSPNLPRDLAQPVAFPKGSSVLMLVKLVFATGAPIPLYKDSAASLVLKVRRNSLDTFAFITKTVECGQPSRYGQNIVPIEITPQDTAGGGTHNLVPMRYVYDLTLTFDGGRNVVVPLSPFVVQPGAVRVPA